MFKINIQSEDYPTFAEALKARDEVDILSKQSLELFFSKPVQHVLFELECRHQIISPLTISDIFYYGYILGKRAERARRKSKKEPAPSANGTSSKVPYNDTDNLSQSNNITDSEKCQYGIYEKVLDKSGEVL